MMPPLQAIFWIVVVGDMVPPISCADWVAISVQAHHEQLEPTVWLPVGVNGLLFSADCPGQA